MFLIKTLCAEGLNPPSIDNPSYMAIPPFGIFSEPPAFGKTFPTISPQWNTR